MKTKGPPGANLFIVRKMRRGEYDDFSDEQLREAFARFGTLVRCEITVDKDTGAPRTTRARPASPAHVLRAAAPRAPALGRPPHPLATWQARARASGL